MNRERYGHRGASADHLGPSLYRIRKGIDRQNETVTGARRNQELNSAVGWNTEERVEIIRAAIKGDRAIIKSG